MVHKKLCAEVLSQVKTGVSVYAHLYTNDHTPALDDADDASDYTEADFTGYAPLELDTWGATTEDDGLAYAEHPLVWNPSGGASGSVRGVYFTLGEDGYLLAAVKFPSPLAVVSGTPLTTTFRLTAKDPSA